MGGKLDIGLRMLYLCKRVREKPEPMWDEGPEHGGRTRQGWQGAH